MSNATEGSSPDLVRMKNYILSTYSFTISIWISAIRVTWKFVLQTWQKFSQTLSIPSLRLKIAWPVGSYIRTGWQLKDGIERAHASTWTRFFVHTVAIKKYYTPKEWFTLYRLCLRPCISGVPEPNFTLWGLFESLSICLCMTDMLLDWVAQLLGNWVFGWGYLAEEKSCEGQNWLI